MVFQTHNPRLSDEWTPDRIALLLKLDAENTLSRSGIANEMHKQLGTKFSRNAIIGKLARLGVPKKAETKRVRKLKPSKEKKIAVRFFRPAPRPTPAQIEAESSLCVSMEGLRETSCRFITSADGLPAEFCGHPIFDRSYCGAHYAICYQQVADLHGEGAGERMNRLRAYKAALVCEAT